MFIFEALVSVLFSFLVLRNLRLNVNSTSVVITSVLLFLLFAENRKFRLFDSRRDQILTLVFSMTLAAANNLGSHVHIDFDAPWGNAALNHITAYSIVDILSIVVLTLVIYCAVNVLIREIEALSARHSRQNVKKVIPFWIPMAVMFIFWMPYFILYYPGFVFGDSLSSIEQALGYWELSNHHPVMYTLFIKLCIMIGKVLAGSLTLGCAVYTVCQMLFVSYALSREVSWLSRHKCPVQLSVVITMVYALLPFFGDISIAMWKDPWFAAGMVLLTMDILDLVEATEFQKGIAVRAAAAALIVCFSRNNGVYALIFTILVILLCMIQKKERSKSVRALCVLVPVVVVYLVISGPMYTACGVIPSERVESVGLCLNQMARVVVQDGDLSDEDRKFMNNLLPLDEYRQVYMPCLVDSLKWCADFNGNYLNDHMDEFFSTYISIGRKNFKAYIGGWAILTYGYWAPNYWELSKDGRDIAWGNPSNYYTNRDGYPNLIVTDLPEMNYTEWHGMHNDAMPYRLFPADGTIISMGIASWYALFAISLAMLRRDIPALVSVSVSVGIVLTLMIASPIGYWQRYELAQYYLLPFYSFIVFRCCSVKK